MKWIKCFFWWCSGTSTTFADRTNDKNIWKGWLVFSFSLLATFFIGIGNIQYFSSLYLVSPTAEQTTQPILEIDSVENEVVDSNLLQNDTTQVKQDLEDQVPELVAIHFFPAKSFLSKHAFPIGIVSGLILGTLFFFLLRWIVSRKDSYHKLERFLWWCAGARLDLLEKSPSDHAKYFGIGATILFTALMAFLAGGYAFYTAFDDRLLSILFGLFWGALIFNLDRYIVSSVGRGDGTAKITWQEFLTGAPRMVLATLIAIVVATPLELKVFEKEITIEVQKMIDEKRQELARGQDYNLQEIQMIKNEINRLKQEEDSLEYKINDDPLINELLDERKELEKELNEINRKKTPYYNRIASYRSQNNDYTFRLNDSNIDPVLKSDLERRLRINRDRITNNQIAINALDYQAIEKGKDIATKQEEIDELQEDNRAGYRVSLARIKNSIEYYEVQMANIQAARRDKIVQYEEIAQQYSGLMAKLQAMDRLSYEEEVVLAPLNSTRNSNDTLKYNASSILGQINLSNTDTAFTALSAVDTPVTIKKTRTPIFYAKWLITILFICIEIAPILFKMMTEAGPYDDRLEEERFGSEVKLTSFKQKALKEAEIGIQLNTDIETGKANAEKLANQEIAQYIAKSQKEIVEWIIDHWKTGQLEKLRDNPEAFLAEAPSSNGKPLHAENSDFEESV